MARISSRALVSSSSSPSVFGVSSFRTKKRIMAYESGKKSKLNTAEEFPYEAEDRISALPDSVLLHILSFLSTIEVVRTCLLSQRWRFLWTDILEIHLVEESEDIMKVCSFVDWVGRMLVAFDGKCLNTFAVEFCYDKCFASNVNSWVQFVVKNKVKNITLRCHDLIECEYEYKLPQMLYSHSSMTSLTVCSTDMAPRGAIKWESLKSLSIEQVRLEECLMEKILSGCPVLEALHLKECWGLNCLNISSPSLATLLIEDWELYVREEDVFLEISAPYVLDLSIIDSKGGYEYKLINVLSIVRAKLYFDSEDIDEHADPSPMDYMKELLESLQSVKELELGPWCVEVLSMLEVKGWQLPPSTRRCLTLNVWVHKRSIAGILSILKSSPNLERIVIKGTPFPHKETESEDLDAAYLQNANLDLVAFHVKTVKISTFTESFCSVEPMATLVQLLLKGSTVLEKMVISAKELDINKSAVTLISFPRASSKAVIVFD